MAADTTAVTAVIAATVTTAVTAVVAADVAAAVADAFPTRVRTVECGATPSSAIIYRARGRVDPLRCLSLL